VDDYEEELDRWIRRAERQRRQLRAGSEQERQLSQAIRGMEVEQLGRRIKRTQSELRELPPGSGERRKLAQTLKEWDDEYVAGREAVRVARLQTGPRDPTARARAALERASSYLLHPAPDAGLHEAIAEIEQALARLKEVRGP
jgi:DNA repair ATPase RecN